MQDKLTNTQRHNRLFVLMAFGFLLVGTTYFLVVDPNWMKFVVAIAPVIVSGICIYCMHIAGMNYFRTGCLVSVAVTTGLEVLIFWGHLGSHGHQRFLATMLFLVYLNVAVYIFTGAFMFVLARNVRWSRRKVEVIDYKGKFR
jgi:hypothetical protein